jgi:hypothetical protein
MWRASGSGQSAIPHFSRWRKNGRVGPHGGSSESDEQIHTKRVDSRAGKWVRRAPGAVRRIPCSDGRSFRRQHAKRRALAVPPSRPERFTNSDPTHPSSVAMDHQNRSRLAVQAKDTSLKSAWQRTGHLLLRAFDQLNKNDQNLSYVDSPIR